MLQIAWVEFCHGRYDTGVVVGCSKLLNTVVAVLSSFPFPYRSLFVVVLWVGGITVDRRWSDVAFVAYLKGTG